MKASSTGANAGTIPNNDENRTPRQLVGRPEKSLSKKGGADWEKKAVVRDVVRCSDDVEGENEQPATENGKRKRQCGACRRPDPGTERTKATRACAAHPGLGARLKRRSTACQIAEKNFYAHPPVQSTKRLSTQSRKARHQRQSRAVNEGTPRAVGNGRTATRWLIPAYVHRGQVQARSQHRTKEKM